MGEGNHESRELTRILVEGLAPGGGSQASLSFNFSKDLSISSGNNAWLNFDYVDAAGNVTSWPGASAPVVTWGNEDMYVTLKFLTADGINSADPGNSSASVVPAGSVLMRAEFDNDTSLENGVIGIYSRTFALANQNEFDLDIAVGGTTLSIGEGCLQRVQQVPEPTGVALMALSSLLLFGRRR